MFTGIKYIEKFTEGLSFVYGVKEVIFTGKTKFQKVDIVDTLTHGRVLFLDEKIQSAEIDEFIFHESLVFPALVVHPNPERVLILGGGEGATLRDVLKFKKVKWAYMVDIDGELVELCKRHMPQWSQGAFDNPRTKLIIDDARNFVMNSQEKFNVVFSDLTEPVNGGPSTFLFTLEFYKRVKELFVNPYDCLVIQAGTTGPVYNEFFASLVKTLKMVFKRVYPYWAFVFSFQMPWGFIMASDELDPLGVTKDFIEKELQENQIENLNYYNPHIHFAEFLLPQYLLRAIEEKGRIITDNEPFEWKA